MASQGTAHGRFERAIKRGNLFQAELAIREMGGLSLLDALGHVPAAPAADMQLALLNSRDTTTRRPLDVAVSGF
jgi:hypothetical protein